LPSESVGLEYLELKDRNRVLALFGMVEPNYTEKENVSYYDTVTCIFLFAAPKMNGRSLFKGL
jgi:hypothetical protein